MPFDHPALLAQLQPITPWRCGAGRSGEPASLVSSDSLFAALSNAMERLGWGEWVSEGAASVRLGSLFPAQGDLFYAPLPDHVRLMPGMRRLRLESVRFASLQAIASMTRKEFEESRWVLDLASGCLLPADRSGAGGPFRSFERTRAAVDRISGVAAPAATVEAIDFSASASVWTLIVLDSAEAAGVWVPRLKGAFRLLADDGIGGWRSAGWGRSRRPRFREGSLSKLLDHMGWEIRPGEQPAGHWWFFGLYTPGPADNVAWDGGAYATVTCGGWSAGGTLPEARFVREGGVIACPAEPGGENRKSGEGRERIRFGAGLAIPWGSEV